MANLDLFSYTKVNSRLHRTHPTLKIVLLSLISFSIVYGSKYALIYYLILIIFGFITSKLTLLFHQFKYLLFITISITLFQIVINRDFSIIAIVNTLIYILRITEVILLGNLFTGTTRPQDITQGLYNIIRNKKLSENISLTIRLIPTFLISWNEIEQSLNSRGLYLRKNPFVLLKNISIPIIVDTFKKADSISTAMESRCYSGWIEEKVRDTNIDIPLIIIVILPYLLWIGMLVQSGL